MRAAAGPAVGVVLAWHVVFTLLHSVLFTNTIWLMPMLVRLRFGSVNPDLRDWQTALVTAAGPTFLLFSIFWNALLDRVPLRTYLLAFWLAAALPLGCVGLVQDYWQLLACQVVATIGGSAWVPVNGVLLKRFYPDTLRGRAYAVINAVLLIAAIGSAWLIGRWLEADPNGFRVYLPAAAVLQLVALGIVWRLARRTGAAVQPAGRPWSWSAVLEPVVHMGAVLRADRRFARFEQAFMTYGAAFMLCDALLPVLATDRLHMRYEDYAQSTQMALRFSMLALMLPLGWLQDRIGAVRLSTLAFASLSVYPLLLLWAGSPSGLAVASLVYGVGMAGVQLGWMLGPVMLAGSPERVPQYVAIHATLVGVRGIVFQGLGMLLYKLTDSFTWPLLVAAAAFLWAAWQMWRLHRLPGTAHGMAPAAGAANAPH